MNVETNDYIVLTEEYPSVDEIKIMLSLIGHTTSENYEMNPCIVDDDKFEGKWLLIFKNSKGEPSIIVNIYLFKGKSSSVDYILLNGDCDLSKGDAGSALVILESTKTCDDSSRNTSVYQRITKFVMYDRMYPESNAIKVMFYCDNKWNNDLTPTAEFGMKVKTTLGIHIYSLNDNGDFVNIQYKFKIKPFTSTVELIDTKNCMRQKKGNANIRMEHRDNTIAISLKLDKGKTKQSGIISHDPNVGFLCGVISCFEKFNPQKEINYIIKNHGVKQTYFDKLRESKLWYCLHGINNIEFEGCKITKRPELPDRYFTIESKMTEKLSTILCETKSIDNYKTIFSNHGACALTSIKGKSCEVNVGRKMHRPDLVLMNSEMKQIVIIEGKVEADLSKGINQLSDDHLNGFISIIKQQYEGYTIKKSLCITISDIKDINKYDNLEYPVIFAIDENGRFLNLL